MLSRLALRTVQRNNPISKLLAVRSVSSTSPKKAEKSDQRDNVNFPRRSYPEKPGGVRLGIFPEEWFTAFHDKTGVSGPYMLVGGLTVFLLSKEIWIIEHDFIAAIAMGIMGITAYQTYGQSIAKFLNKSIDADIEKLRSIKQTEIQRCKNLIAEEEMAQWMATSYETLIEVKRENVALQLETAYRSRLQEVYQQVKKRLDYQVETNNVIRRMEQKHMVSWIIDNVRKSITPKQEDDALKQCIQDLKAMA